MPAGITLLVEGNPVNDVVLSETNIDDGLELSAGKPVKITAANTGTTGIRDIEIGLTGPGSNNVQLAIDNDGGPGVWADRSQPIALSLPTIFPGDKFEFWARGAYEPVDVEDSYEFDFVVSTTSIG